MKQSNKIRKKLLSVLLMLTLIMPFITQNAQAIEPWSAEMSAIGTPGVDSSDYEGYDGNGWEHVIEAAGENRLYISTVNKLTTPTRPFTLPQLMIAFPMYTNTTIYKKETMKSL